MTGYQAVLRLQRRQLEVEKKEAASWSPVNGASTLDGVSDADLASIAAGTREAIREFVRHRDLFAVTYRKALRLAPKLGKRDIEQVTREALRLCRAAIDQRDTLRRLVERLAAVGRPVAGTERLERAAADFERWLEDVPDEMLLHYRPVTDAVERIARESLGNPPQASDWRSLFKKGARSRL
jgi:hypothetical protein